MKLKDIIGSSADGYRLDKLVDSTTQEWRFEAEALRSGVLVHVRLPRTNIASHSPALAVRYQNELDASSMLPAAGPAVANREIVEIHGQPALVSDRPSGQSLADMFSKNTSSVPLATVLEWFRSLVLSIEAAHRDNIAHGHLGASDIFQDDDGQIELRGLALFHDAEDIEQAKRADVFSLAQILYQATTGQRPEAGFPYIGQPTPAEQIVDGYPESLSRFLSLRLAADADDPVRDAGIFRRSLDAIAQFAEVQLQIERSRPARRPEVVFEHGRKEWGRFLGPLAIVAVAALAGAGATSLYHQGQTQQLPTETSTVASAAPTSMPMPNPTTIDHTNTSRLEVWHCLHHEFSKGGDGRLTMREIMRCMRADPDLTVDEVQVEAMRILSALQTEPNADDSKESQNESYRRLFALGVDEVDLYLSYRMARQLPLDNVERWVQQSAGQEAVGVLRTLANRPNPVGQWAATTLQRVHKTERTK
ncbi:MAG: hypothetical protein VX223_15335 [Myxococcota bacterium]|nr:hypothetical protein [Myxococcota bacterium]